MKQLQLALLLLLLSTLAINQAGCANQNNPSQKPKMLIVKVTLGSITIDTLEEYYISRFTMYPQTNTSADEKIQYTSYDLQYGKSFSTALEEAILKYVENDREKIIIRKMRPKIPYLALKGEVCLGIFCDRAHFCDAPKL